MIQCLGKIPSNVQSAVYHYFGGTTPVLGHFRVGSAFFDNPRIAGFLLTGVALPSTMMFDFPSVKLLSEFIESGMRESHEKSQAGASAGGAAASQGEDTYRATGPTKGLSCDLVYKYVFSNRWNCGVCVVFFQVKYDELDKNIVLFGGSCDIFFWEG